MGERVYGVFFCEEGADCGGDGGVVVEIVGCDGGGVHAAWLG